MNSSFRYFVFVSLVAVSSIARSEVLESSQDEYLQVLDHEEFIRLPEANRAAYIEVLRDTLVELAESERGGKYEYFNGTDERYSVKMGGWRGGYAAILSAFAAGAAQAQDVFDPGPTVEMPDYEYARRRKEIENRVPNRVRGAGIPFGFEEKKKADLAALDAEYKARKQAKEAEQAKWTAQALQANENARRAERTAREAKVFVARSGQQSDPSLAADLKKIDAKYETTKEKMLAGSTGGQGASALASADGPKKESMGAGASNPSGSIAIGPGPNQSATAASLRETLMRTGEAAPACVFAKPKCPDPKTTKGQKAIENAARQMRVRGSACIYGGLPSNRRDNKPNIKLNMRPRNCRPQHILPVAGIGTIACKKKNQVLCNPMLFGVEGSLEKVGTEASVIDGRCVDNSSTVTGDCDVKFRQAQAERQKSGNKGMQFWDLQVLGVSNLFNQTANSLNTACTDEATWIAQCNECVIIQRRLSGTKKIARCATTANSSAGRSGSGVRSGSPKGDIPK